MSAATLARELVVAQTRALKLLFNLITDRYERRATVVTTNLAVAE